VSGFLERYWKKVSPEPNSGCWLWEGVTNQAGYGRIYVSTHRARVAHCVAYEIDRGAIPRGMQLDHVCRVRCCCNPDHLEPVTQQENMRRGWRARGQDIVGLRFGRLVVLARVENDKKHQSRFLCRCDCGREKVARGYSLKTMKARSCGCFQREAAARANFKHGRYSASKLTEEFNL
jgi:hypothetical protein